MIMSSELLHAERKGKKDPRLASEKILETVKIDPANYRFGETKVVFSLVCKLEIYVKNIKVVC